MPRPPGIEIWREQLLAYTHSSCKLSLACTSTHVEKSRSIWSKQLLAQLLTQRFWGCVCVSNQSLTQLISNFNPCDAFRLEEQNLEEGGPAMVRPEGPKPVMAFNCFFILKFSKIFYRKEGVVPPLPNKWRGPSPPPIPPSMVYTQTWRTEERYQKLFLYIVNLFYL